MIVFLAFLLCNGTRPTKKWKWRLQITYSERILDDTALLEATLKQPKLKPWMTAGLNFKKVVVKGEVEKYIKLKDDKKKAEFVRQRKRQTKR